MSKELATQILNNSNITLHTCSPIDCSQGTDGADAKQNIVDTSNGEKAKRSSYGNAPGGEVAIDERVLKGMLKVAEKYKIRITSIAGGEHQTRQSLHYQGRAFDVDMIDGKRVAERGADDTVKNLMEEARKAGASKVLGPPNDSAGHSRHVHSEWGES
jgi:zinc D-Ala-D-Ala carboxypeptidase